MVRIYYHFTWVLGYLVCFLLEEVASPVKILWGAYLLTTLKVHVPLPLKTNIPFATPTPLPTLLLVIDTLIWTLDHAPLLSKGPL